MNKLPFLALPLLLPAALGCRPAGPDYAPPRPDLPAAYAVPVAGAPRRDRWWTGFADPRLDALVERAFQASPDLQAAAARLRQARARQGVAEAAGGPAAEATARASRDRLSQNSEGFANLPRNTAPRTDFDNYQAGFDASWELDFFGHDRRLAEAARARAEAAGERLRDVRVMLAAEVARNYIEYRLAQRRVALAANRVAACAERARLARRSAEAGNASALEVQRVERDLADSQAAATAPAAALRQALTALGVLTALPFPTLERDLGEGGGLMAVPEPPAGGVPSDLLQRRPDLRAAERDLAAANADVGVATADLYPRFSLVGQAGWTSIHAGSLLDQASQAWSLGPQMSLPLFNRGRLRSQVRADRAAFDAALADYHKAVLTALADVDLAFTRMARDEDARRAAQAAELRQADTRALTERRWQAGDVSRMEALEAEQAILDRQDQSAQAQARSLTALVAIHKALGGGWQPE